MGPEDLSAAANFVSGAMRYAEQYAAEFGCVRCSPHLTLFEMDYPFSRSDLTWMSDWAFLSKVDPALAAAPSRLVEGVPDHPDLAGASREGDGFAYQFAARLCQGVASPSCADMASPG